MENKIKIEIPFGEGKRLAFNADLTNKQDVDFAFDLEAVKASKPKSLQEFITKLIEIQANNKTGV